MCNLLLWLWLLLLLLLLFFGFPIAVPPFITVHPESKIRMPGQSVTFCCDGQGNPPPEIEWQVYVLSLNMRVKSAGESF